VYSLLKEQEDNVADHSPQDPSEAEIAVHWQEEQKIAPPATFIAQANLADPDIYARFSLEHFPECFKECAELLDWEKYWEKTFDDSQPPFWKWFVGGRINASYNCVDRHAKAHPNRTAIHYVPEPEDEPTQHITYRELYRRVNEVAALLRDQGLKAGDRVTIHMPMIPELPIAMLACARLGVVHSVVFAGFSGKACADRIVDSASRWLITADGYYRNGTLLNHKEKADIAFEEAKAQGHTLEGVLIFERKPGHYGSPTPLTEGRDHLANLLLRAYRGKTVAPVPMPSEAPLFLMYTSGTTGKPKGAQHGTAGYLSWVAWTSKNILDIHPEDVYWCMADIGWITGHSYIVYGPLALGTSTVMYEGVPGYPDPSRPWRIAEELGVNIFHTSPTAIRQMRKDGPDGPAKHAVQFKLMVTVGEPIEPDVWRWYYHSVGKGQAVIMDTWWQTETGGFLCAHLPALGDMKPGSAGPGLPGIHPVILDDNGHEVPAGSGRAGNMVIRNPWPGVFQNIWGNPERYLQTYYARYNRDPNSQDWRDWPYFAGDGAVLASDGYFRILGRVDDVINVAGHRLGSKEIESAALTVPEVAEAAVVPVTDPIKGTVPDVFISLRPGTQASLDIGQRVSAAISREISPIARPRKVWLVPDLPKTRSGKIMRRVLAAISNQRDTGDVTTLSNPEIVEAIRKLESGDSQL
jgi:acetyl-CoA synthetase